MLTPGKLYHITTLNIFGDVEEVFEDPVWVYPNPEDIASHRIFHKDEMIGIINSNKEVFVLLKSCYLNNSIVDQILYKDKIGWIQVNLPYSIKEVK